MRDTYDLRLSDDAIEDHIASYQNMVAARHQDPQELATLDRDSKQIVLTIDGLGLKVVLWISDKQVAFVKCVAEMFPDVPHRFCAIHFFRDLAKPVLALDSAAK